MCFGGRNLRHDSPLDIEEPPSLWCLLTMTTENSTPVSFRGVTIYLNSSYTFKVILSFALSLESSTELRLAFFNYLLCLVEFQMLFFSSLVFSYLHFIQSDKADLRRLSGLPGIWTGVWTQAGSEPRLSSLHHYLTWMVESKGSDPLHSLWGGGFPALAGIHSKGQFFSSLGKTTSTLFESLK